jgi:hypothetical protein
MSPQPQSGIEREAANHEPQRAASAVGARRPRSLCKTADKLTTSNLAQRENHSRNIGHLHHTGSAKENART